MTEVKIPSWRPKGLFIFLYFTHLQVVQLAYSTKPGSGWVNDADACFPSLLLSHLFVPCISAIIPRYCTCDTDCGPEPESPTFVPMIWGYHVGHHHNVEDDDEANKERYRSLTSTSASSFFVRRTILGTMTSPTRLPRSKKHFNPDVRPSAKYQTKLKTQIPHNP